MPDLPVNKKKFNPRTIVGSNGTISIVEGTDKRHRRITLEIVNHDSKYFHGYSRVELSPQKIRQLIYTLKQRADL